MERALYDNIAIRPRTGKVAPAGIPELRADFPQFRIWREVTGERDRYIARS